MSESLADFERRQHEVNDLRDANMRLATQLRDAKHKVDILVDATITAARDAVLSQAAIKPVPRPAADKRSRKAEVALWHMTDWQGAKVTPSYNSAVMVERVMRFCEKARRITEIQRADHPVAHGVLALGGDMVEGLFQFPTQAHEIDQTLFGQYTMVGRTLIDVVRFGLSIYDTFEVVAEWGNHGRIGDKRSCVPKSDNFDRMAYELARQVLEVTDPERLTWTENGAEDIQRIEVGNYRALLIHGDEVGRAGMATPTTIVQHVNRWKAGAYDPSFAFRDAYVGHFHNHSEMALADGESSVYWTGSTESDNRYARDSMAASGKPSQRLHFIDPEGGRVTATYRVFVDGS